MTIQELLPDPIQHFSLTTVDDVFEHSKRMGIKEVDVTPSEMYIIVKYLLLSLPANPRAFELMTTGKVEYFWGVKLNEL